MRNSHSYTEQSLIHRSTAIISSGLIFYNETTSSTSLILTSVLPTRTQAA